MGHSQVLVLHPGTPKTAIKSIEDDDLALGDQDTPDSDRETVFELEWQLRDFISHNIESLKLEGDGLYVCHETSCATERFK